MLTRRLAPMLLATALLGIAACGARTSSDGRPDVVAAFYPLAWLARQVGGNDVTVHNLTRPGAEPHDLELTPKQVLSVGQAKLAFYVRGVQPAVDKAIAEHAKNHSLDAQSLVTTLPATEGEGAHGAADPHLWLDPARFATVATALGDRLARVDAPHAGAYRSRARQTAAALTALDKDFRTGLASCRQKTIVTAHEAFAYLADRYGLKQVGVSGLDPESEPSPKRIGDMAVLIKRTGATTVFTETLVSPKVAQTLAQAAGVRTAVLDPVEGIRSGSNDDYPSIMRRNLATLRPALECR